MDFDFSQLDARKFQHMAQALAIKVLGSDLTVLGDGPDGGRDAAFRGPVSFPGPAPQNRWDGYGVLQVKFRQRPQSTREDTAWFIEQVRSELAGWAADRDVAVTAANVGDRDTAAGLLQWLRLRGCRRAPHTLLTPTSTRR